MHFTALALQLLALASISLASPTPNSPEKASRALSAEKRAASGSYTVSGLGTRKQAVTSAGGTTFDMAIAMLETDTMIANYAYGDNKVGDSFNAGIFKQNWGMLRVCSSQFKGQATADYNNGAVLNTNLQEDITARHECESCYGPQTWFAGHRNGASGLSNPNTADINTYISAVKWIESQLETNTKYLTDDTRFYVDVTAI